ncbi:PIG-L family deacetylase [Rothia sp. LK2588]|uniref:PIG-L family deacetylase n=1 Tax=Rothia sp. LK2588 TaxID=3114369 RepID=UPI0034CDE499
MTDAHSSVQPYYPPQGTVVDSHAVDSLLPPGLDPAKAKILFLHAHPDDESTATGATIGHYAEQGASVYLLTMTRGEMGEVIPEEFKYLQAADGPATDHGDGLGRLRTIELRAAAKALGIKKRLYLGQQSSFVPGSPGYYRDSGMEWGADGRATANSQAASDCLTATDLTLQARAIATVIYQLNPDVVVAYDHDGGYGHPDHLRTFQAADLAIRTLVADEHQFPVYFWGLEGDVQANDTRQQAVIDGSLERKKAGMAEHVTQLTITGEDTFEYSNGVTQKISPRETYRLLWSAADATTRYLAQD